MNKRPVQTQQPPDFQPDQTEKSSLVDQARHTMHQANQYMTTARRVTKESIDWFANFLFDTTIASGRFRRWLFIVLAAAFWGVAAYLNNPPEPNYDFFIYPIQTLFHPKIFRHVLVIGITFWLSLKLSAIYLNDVFELENPEIAERYILQASLANLFPQIEIKDGQAQDSQDSPLVLIGGPGLVRVHYDSAALFEKYNGEPTVIIAEDGLVALDRFERLRRVVRLRDHIDETTISTRTRDGIPVSAQGVRIKYYLLRYEDLPKAEKIPFPVVREAVEKQVYRETVIDRLDPLTLNGVPANKAPESKNSHPETLNISHEPISAELRRFINQATLSEFLAAISEPELNQLLEDSQQLEQDALSLSGGITVPDTQNGKPLGSSSPPDFQPRSAITRQIYKNFRKGPRLATGLELEWIDIGTWVLPDHAKEIVKQHEEAWRQSLENLKTRSDIALDSSENESKIKATRMLLREIIYQFRSMENNPDGSEIVNALLNQYLQKLGLALDIYKKQANSRTKPVTITRLHNLGLADQTEEEDAASGSPIQISKAITHLGTLLKQIRTAQKP